MSSSPSISSSAPAPSASNACASVTDFSKFPTKDAACAVGGTSGVPSNYNDILKDCCKTAPVESWASDCALYCLAVDQSIFDLQKCWQEGGVISSEIFCNSGSNATATGSPSGSGAKETGSESGTATGGAAGATDSPGAARVVVAPQGVSKAGLGMLAIILGSAMFGALL